MKQKITTAVLTAGVLLAASGVRAQVRFSVGPRVGLNLATVPFKDRDRTYHTNARAGVEAGLLADIGFGHFALQPALLYSQKGFTVDDTYTTSNDFGNTIITALHEKYRLNYFTIPLNFAYAQRSNGQGVQLFAGPYLGFLLGGTYSYDDRKVVTAGGTATTYSDKADGDVGTGDYYTTNRTDTKFYSRRLDAGLQFGLGYRVGGALFQAGYSLGLRNLGADFKTNYGQFGTQIASGPFYTNHTVQASFTYLFGPKS